MSSSSNSLVYLSLEPLPSAMASGVRIRQETRQISDRILEAKSEVRQNSDLSTASSDKQNTKPSKSYRKRGWRPRKPTEHPLVLDPQGGLVSSQYATASKPKGFDSPSKGGKCRGNQRSSMYLLSEITLSRSSAHERKKLSKSVKVSEE